MRMTLNEAFKLTDCKIIYVYAGYLCRFFDLSNPCGFDDAKRFLLIAGNKEVDHFHYYTTGDTIPTFHIFLKGVEEK